MVTGNPVRAEIYRGSREEGRKALGLGEGDLLLMVLGGSQGALQINRLIGELAPKLVKRCRILHQMGSLTFEKSTLEGYETREFIGPELPDYLAAADLVVSRAGAGTLWELAALRKPMVLIPLGTGSSRGDQLKNAELLKKRGAAEVLSGEVTVTQLEELLTRLLDDKARREALSSACGGLVEHRGDEVVADLILAELKEKGKEGI